MIVRVVLVGILVWLLFMIACQDGADKQGDEQIQITYSVEVSGNYPSLQQVTCNAEYANANGIQKETLNLNSDWEKSVSVPRGHNLVYRVKGEVVSGVVTIRATAVDLSSGVVLYSENLSESVPFNTSSMFDFELNSYDLGN